MIVRPAPPTSFFKERYMEGLKVIDRAKIGDNLYIFGCEKKGVGKFVALLKVDDKGNLVRMAHFGDKDYEDNQRHGHHEH